MSDEESTQQIDVDALRARARESVHDEEDLDSSSPHDRETARGRENGGDVHEERTVMAPSPRGTRRRKDTAATAPGRGANDSISIEIDLGTPEDEFLDGDEHADDIEDVSDDEDVSLITDRRRIDPNLLDFREPEEEQPYEDEARSLIGTVPGHDVAQALRAMMGDVPDTPLDSESNPDQPEDSLPPMWEPRRTATFEENETMTRMPTGAPSDLGRQYLRNDAPAPDEYDEPDEMARLGRTSEEDALPAFSLDESSEEEEPDPAPWRPPHSLDVQSITHTSTSARQILEGLDRAPPPPENTAITRAVPSPSNDDVDRLLEQTRATDRGAIAFPDPDELPSTTSASTPSVRPQSMRDTLNNEGEISPSLDAFRARPFRSEPPPASLTSAGMAQAPLLEPEPAPDDELPRFSMASLPDIPEASYLPGPATHYLPRTDPLAEAPVPPPLTIDADLEAAPGRVEEDEETSTGRSAVADEAVAMFDEPAREPAPSILDDADLIELVPEEIVDDLGSTDQNPAITGETKPPPAPDKSTYRPPEQRTSPPPAIAMQELDSEEQELIDEGKFSLLVALYRQRLGATDGPNKKAAILLKIARVYEDDIKDLNETFTTLIDAFEIVPDNEEVVAELDRVGKETQRMGELADRVKKRMVPGASDDKRVAYLGHVVYWYERVLGRGSEVSSLVSDIERVDKVHPLVLKRAAQLAAMNSDVKTQREHLARALERTVRAAEKVQLQLALASAWAGTPEAMKHYEAALTLDPTSIVALQGVKRLGKEKELYPQVKWALERQAEVAATEAEKIDAMIELAELEETKFLKRELAAQLLEQVLALDGSHPQALKGLERCYHALRDWPALARILAIRAEHAFEKKAKVELFELAAEVHESKLGDPAGAVEVYKNLLIVEPKHRRALSDLGRLYEKLGDWDNVALYKARLAELAPTKRASSQELVKLGDYLNTPERDPLAAKLQYEKAVQIDPTNAVAWEAIQKMAQEAGDEARVIECLEARKKHTDIPRQRAAVLVELARVQAANGDEEAAKKSYEAAIRADSSNEAAAIAMLDAYTSDERWAEAAPLCELLVNAAIRDRDNDALFIRLRLQTRIAAALGDAERALTASMAALDAQSHDLGAQADLLAVASQCSGTPSLLRAKEHLARIAGSLDDLTTDQIVKLAVLHRELKDLDIAARCYEGARRREPNNEQSTKELSEIYLEQLDFPRACKLKVDLARNAASGEARFKLLLEAGEIWAKRADELEIAATVFEEAREIKPQDAFLLQTLRWLYTELSEWEMVCGVLEDTIQTEENAAKKLELIMGLADLARDQLDDPVRSTDALDRALDLDRKRLDLFEGLVRSLTEAKDWDRLERSYRKMIARVKDDEEPQLQFLLFHQLGLIYRDRLGDASRAFDALDAASRLEPENVEVRKIVIELLIVTDNLDNAVGRIRDEIERDPHQPELYAELYELFLRQHFFDKAWCCVNVLARLQTPTNDQRRFHEDYAPMPLDRIPGQIVEQAWQSHVFHRDLDPALTNILAILTPAVARMRFGQLRPEQRVGRPFTPTHSRMHAAVRETFDNASEILAVQAPELLVADLNSIHPFAPALAPFGAVLVCGPAIEAQSVSLVYLCGKRLAEQRPELAARAFFPAEKELATLLASAMRVARNEGAREATGTALDAALSVALSPQEGAQLRAAMMSALADNTAFDVKRWLQAADLSSMRAGLLISGDVEQARQAIGCEVAAASDLSPRDKLGELLRFAVSDLYSDLRGAIGVAVQA